MSKLPSLFDSFDNLDQLSSEAVASWITPLPQLNQIENHLANRILYPQVIPQTALEMQMDLAILREALKASKVYSDTSNNPKSRTSVLLGDNPFINTTLRKLLIPLRFLNFVPSIATLTWVFIDAFLTSRKKDDWFEDLWTVVVTDDVDEIVGSVLLAQFNGMGGIIDLKLPDKNYKVIQGALTVIPCPKDRCRIAYKAQKGRILGKEDNAIEVYGGKLGLMIDGRNI